MAAVKHSTGLPYHRRGGGAGLGLSVVSDMARATDSMPPDVGFAFSEFLRDFPRYAETKLLDDLRAREYTRLDRRGHVYLDYTGAGIHADSQIREHLTLLNEEVLGNPHSDNPASRAATERVERARATVLRHFHAAPDEYVAIFTPNASGALKHAGESYPFGPGGRFLLPFDNHNSVNGIREFARVKGAAIDYAPLHRADLRIDRDRLRDLLARAAPARGNLFAYPAQSNFSGVQHPLELIEEAHAAGWDVLLDAAAFVPTNRLDLGRWKPDLVALSFYKMFGYPTGVGCLLMRRNMLAKLQRPWFAGGTVRIASVQADGHHFAEEAAAYEDGTVNYLSLPAVEIGLRHLFSDAGIDLVHERVRCLTGWLLQTLTGMRHRNGRPCAQVHGPATLDARGGAIAFNLIDVNGESFDIHRIEELANRNRISLRTGCFCNPGTGETIYGLTAEQIAPYFRNGDGMDFDELRSRIRAEHGKEVGAVRVSLGLPANFADVFRFARFLDEFRDRTAAEVGRGGQPPISRR